jgi:hypothetical protein
MKKKEEVYISHVLFPWETFAAQAEREQRERENGGARWTDEFRSGEHFHHLFLSVCGGKARLADRWSTYDENDERTEHWECRAIELDELRELGLVEEVAV